MSSKPVKFLDLALTAGALCLVSPLGWGQQRDVLEDYMKAANAYERCIITYSERFAMTPESPSDIASAAFSSCYSEATAFHISIMAMGRVSQEFKDALKIMERFKNAYRQSAIKAILEKRYPATDK